MPYELFDPTRPCTSLLPLNPVEHKLTFYKVNIFEISLEDIAEIADLPVAYARRRRSKDKLYLGLPISTLFSELREKYQEFRLDVNEKIPVLMGLEGSFLPFDPNRPVPKPLPEHSVSIADLDKGRTKVGKTTIALDDNDQFRLATQGFAFVKVNGGTVRLSLNEDGDSNGR